MDDMIDHALPFITERVDAHLKSKTSKPYFVALNGVQGAGKTTLVTAIAQKLRSPPFSLSTVILSIDDFYLTHQDQLQLAAAHPNNPLVQHRGQPSTHDFQLWKDVFSNLQLGEATKIPQYDKSRFNGQGDRVESRSWEAVNEPGQPPVQVVIFEGWCVGFRSLQDEILQLAWKQACNDRIGRPNEYRGRLGRNRLEDIRLVNEALTSYEKFNVYFDALVHLDAEDPYYVYEWRLEQEAALRKARGNGMTDKQVKKFVDGYYPSYELYTKTLRDSAFVEAAQEGAPPRQLRLVVNKSRKVVKSLTIP